MTDLSQHCNEPSVFTLGGEINDRLGNDFSKYEYILFCGVISAIRTISAISTISAGEGTVCWYSSGPRFVAL